MKEELYLSLIENRNIRINLTKLRMNVIIYQLKLEDTGEMGKYHLKNETCNLGSDNTRSNQIHAVVLCKALYTPIKDVFKGIMKYVRLTKKG